MRAFTVRSNQCPRGILLASHFSDDGACERDEVGAYLAGEDVFSDHERLRREDAVERAQEAAR